MRNTKKKEVKDDGKRRKKQKWKEAVEYPGT